MNTLKFEWPKNEKLIFVRPPKEEYHGKMENFYSPELFPELKIIKDNWEKMRDEIMEYENTYGNLVGQNAINVAGVEGKPWTLIYLKSFMRKFSKNQKKFPFTSSILNSIPNVVFGAVSILPPQTKILPHYGDTNGIIRGHLGIKIPAPHPTIAIRVRDEERGWEDGEIFCFTNVHKHEVWNNSNDRRYVLLFDFVPEPLKDRQLEICSKGLGSQSHNALYVTSRVYRKLPSFVYEVNIWISTLIWKVYLLTINRIKQ